MRRTRVKICGLTRVDDVVAAVQAGADAIGLVFYPASARRVSLDQAQNLRATVPAFVDVVSLFVNATREQVQAVIDHVKPDLLQFHGDESPGFCASFQHRYLRAFRLGAPGLDSPDAVLRSCRQFGDAAGWLFDSYSAGYGGSGQTFDSALLHAVRQAPDSRSIILAGGMTPTSVAAAIQSVQPYAVDVSSGVETSPGIKSAEKIRAFIRAASKQDRVASGNDKPHESSLDSTNVSDTI
ncbi:MAG: phosphoribosylanthranilate isomerase [Candidimonas sp.]|nr:MAG: phosphoribosylanthranilate isomerase [Candidimonas sp.]TAM26318.1 MAG: phosphoribosylanthranilate isomerase [Candidimonas sp.]TAM75104.1 MAG: phosphoribosylanthranilate isomerase [Candidimonas sp.]